MEKDWNSPANGEDDLSIDEILEEARRRQQEREEERKREQELISRRREHTVTDIDELLAGYYSEEPSNFKDNHWAEPEITPEENLSEEPLVSMNIKPPLTEHEPKKNPKPANQAFTFVQDEMEEPDAPRKLFNPAAFSTAASKIYRKKEREPDKANTYISPLPEDENESAQLVWSTFAQKVKETQKAEPAEDLSWDDVHDMPEPEGIPSEIDSSVFSDNHLYYLGQDAWDEETPSLRDKTREVLKGRFIRSNHVIKTDKKTVNFSIQASEEDTGEEKFLKPEPIKTPMDQVVNNPDPEKMPVKRYIQPPTLKTAPLPVINTPEDYLLGDGEKYIKVPDDYVDPFAEKEFHFDTKDGLIEPEETKTDGNTLTAAPAKEPPAAEPKKKELDGQIRLDGFDEAEPVDTIDEAHAEQLLMENRREKVSKFKLHEEAKSKIVEQHEKERVHEPASNAFEKELDFEYRTPNDGARIREELNTQRSYQALKILGLGLIEIFLLWLGLFSQFGWGLPEALSPVTHPPVFLGVNLVLTIAAAAICKNTMINGVKAMLSRKLGSESMLTVCTAAVLIHTSVLMAFPEQVASGDCRVYSSIAVLSLLFGCCGKFSRLTRIAFNLRFLRSKTPKHAVLSIDNPDDAQEIARGAVVGDTNLCYSAPVDFPSDFLELSKKPDHWETTSAKVMPWLFAAAGAVFLITWITQKSFPVALTGFTMLTCVLAPLTLLLAGNLPMRSAGKTLNAHGAMIAGYDSVAKFAETNGVLMDAADLFPAGTTQLFGLKVFNGMRIDDAILYGAAILCESGGPLAHAFNQVIEQRSDILPKAENLNYEDSLGLSGWIYDRRVLLGNREMMLHHDVEMPPAVIENKYLQNDPDRRALYLTVAGQVSAMFIVGYSGNSKIGGMLCALEDNGISLLLRTSDPNINENMISRYFDISPNSVKILSSVGGLMYKEKFHTHKEKAPADMVHNGSLRAYINCVLTAVRLKEKINFSMVLQSFGIILGFLLVGFFSIATGMSQLGPFQLLVYELFWGFVVMFIATLRRL